MGRLANVWVFSDNVERYTELMSGARLWGEQVYLTAQGNEQTDQVKPLGADEIAVFETMSGLQYVGSFTETIAALIRESTGLLLMPTTKRAKSPDAQLSIQLNAAMVNDATSVTLDDGSLFAEHRTYGGLAFGGEKIKTIQAIIILAPDVLEPIEANASRTYSVVPVPYIAPYHEVMCQKRHAKSVSNVDLGKVERVVGVGRGLVAQNNLEMVHQLVSILGAEMGCSRPITEDESWMECERYVGVSDVLLKSGLYLTLGISEQIQHMVDGNGAEVIVAINKDEKAPIFNYASYGLVDGIYKVVPVFVEHPNY